MLESMCCLPVHPAAEIASLQGTKGGTCPEIYSPNPFQFEEQEDKRWGLGAAKVHVFSHSKISNLVLVWAARWYASNVECKDSSQRVRQTMHSGS